MLLEWISRSWLPDAHLPVAGDDDSRTVGRSDANGGRALVPAHPLPNKAPTVFKSFGAIFRANSKRNFRFPKIVLFHLFWSCGFDPFRHPLFRVSAPNTLTTFAMSCAGRPMIIRSTSETDPLRRMPASNPSRPFRYWAGRDQLPAPTTFTWCQRRARPSTNERRHVGKGCDAARPKGLYCLAETGRCLDRLPRPSEASAVSPASGWAERA